MIEINQLDNNNVNFSSKQNNYVIKQIRIAGEKPTGRGE